MVSNIHDYLYINFYIDGDGIIDTKELADAIQKMLRGHETDKEAEALAILLDRDGDGVITVEEINALASDIENKIVK